MTSVIAQLTKGGIDVGLVTTNFDEMHRFYHGLLGFQEQDPFSFTFAGTGTVYRFLCGTSTMRMLVPESAPARDGAVGGITAATGIRYLTLTLANLAEVVGDCEKFGGSVAREPHGLRPGTLAAQVLDPDGNLLELQQVG
jgi:catechol 2,3-dioxygenase-like lactoylglutathione lyase family enzyme